MALRASMAAACPFSRFRENGHFCAGARNLRPSRVCRIGPAGLTSGAACDLRKEKWIDGFSLQADMEE